MSETVESTIVQDEQTKQRQLQKQALLGLLGTSTTTNSDPSTTATTPGPIDPVLADPITKAPIVLSVSGPLLGGQASTSRKITLTSPDNIYSGRSNTYYNLLAPAVTENDKTESEESSNESSSTSSDLLNQLRVFVPPPLRGMLPNGGDYIPMRDLFTSPSVSFAYERGWRQGFAAAGFPGADKEYELVGFKP